MFPTTLPPDDCYRHNGQDYRAGDRLRDGTLVESVDFGIPTLVRVREAQS